MERAGPADARPDAALVEEVARVTGLTKKDTETIVDTVFGSIVQELINRETAPAGPAASSSRR